MGDLGGGLAGGRRDQLLQPSLQGSGSSVARQAIERRAQLRLGVGGAAALGALFQVTRDLGALVRREPPRHEPHQTFARRTTVHHSSPCPGSATRGAGGA